MMNSRLALVFIIATLSVVFAKSIRSNLAYAERAKQQFVEKYMVHEPYKNFIRDVQLSQDHGARQLSAVQEIEEYIIVVTLSEQPPDNLELPKRMGLIVIRYTIIYSDDDRPMTQDTPAVACTMEAIVCPDGTTRGRTGPNCEFEPCTSATNFRFRGMTFLVIPLVLCFLARVLCCICAGCRRRRNVAQMQDHQEIEMEAPMEAPIETETEDVQPETIQSVPQPVYQPYYYIPYNYVPQMMPQQIPMQSTVVQLQEPASDQTTETIYVQQDEAYARELQAKYDSE